MSLHSCTFDSSLNAWLRTCASDVDDSLSFELINGVQSWGVVAALPGENLAGVCQRNSGNRSKHCRMVFEQSNLVPESVHTRLLSVSSCIFLLNAKLCRSKLKWKNSHININIKRPMPKVQLYFWFVQLTIWSIPCEPWPRFYLWERPTCSGIPDLGWPEDPNEWFCRTYFRLRSDVCRQRWTKRTRGERRNTKPEIWIQFFVESSISFLFYIIGKLILKHEQMNTICAAGSQRQDENVLEKDAVLLVDLMTLLLLLWWLTNDTQPSPRHNPVVTSN